MLNTDNENTIFLIEDEIRNFEKSPLNLKSLVTITRSIESRINELKNIEKSWIESLRSEWIELEILSSILIVEEKDVLTEHGEKQVKDAINNMRSLINDLKLGKFDN